MNLLAPGALAQPLARRDLVIVPIENQGRQDWTVKDPIALRYYQLRDEERFLLGLLDGRLSLDEIVARFEQRFAPRRLRRTELAGFLSLLYREGLVAASAFGQGEQLLARFAAQQRRSWLMALGNLLAIRLPGINPDRFLTAAAPWLTWLFSPACLVLVLVLLTTAVSVALVNFGPLVERLPRLTEFFGPHNLIWLAASLAAVKTLHELGHAVTCKQFGGACNRLGIMLLVFTPALYCDVSDAWMFRERWKRIAVSAAGVAVELILAALAVLVWSMTQPGWMNALALNVMVVCSVNTLLINGNPLLRYDGYYVLADWLGTPNLQQQASAAVRRSLAWLLAGVTADQPRFLAEPGRAVLWSYAIMSLIYRGVVVVGILWVVDATLRPLGLGAISLLIALIVIASIVAGPLSRVASFLNDPTLRRQFNGRWFLASVTIFAGAIAAIAMVPMPVRVTAPVVLRPRNGRPIYVTTAGVLASAKPAGERVAAGELVAQLTNRRLELQVAELASRTAQQRLLAEHLSLRQHRDPELGDQLPAAETRLKDLEMQVSELHREIARLQLVAPITGTILPPPCTAKAAGDDLSSFVGTPQAPHNLGCYLESGALLCTIGDPQQSEAVAIVDQTEVQALHEGQLVRLMLRQIPRQILRGRVIEISRVQSDHIPPEIVSERMIPVHTGPEGRVRPLHTYYQAVITLEPHDKILLSGAVGWARIEVAPQPLWLRSYRSVRNTLRTPW
jgi:putative peptide zinc metalloprotease protein